MSSYSSLEQNPSAYPDRNEANGMPQGGMYLAKDTMFEIATPVLQPPQKGSTTAGKFGYGLGGSLPLHVNPLNYQQRKGLSQDGGKRDSSSTSLTGDSETRSCEAAPPEPSYQVPPTQRKLGEETEDLAGKGAPRSSAARISTETSYLWSAAQELVSECKQ